MTETEPTPQPPDEPEPVATPRLGESALDEPTRTTTPAPEEPATADRSPHIEALMLSEPDADEAARDAQPALSQLHRAGSTGITAPARETPDAVHPPAHIGSPTASERELDNRPARNKLSAPRKPGPADSHGRVATAAPREPDPVDRRVPIAPQPPSEPALDEPTNVAPSVSENPSIADRPGHTETLVLNGAAPAGPTRDVQPALSQLGQAGTASRATSTMEEPDSADRRALIALSALCEPGSAALAEHLADRRPAEALAELLTEPDASPLHASIAARARGRDVDGLMEELLAAAAGCGARAVTRYDAEWPGAVDDLAELYDEAEPDTRPPLCLWVRGEVGLAEVGEASVSIVGARCCTPYGREMATRLAFDLARQRWTVVSGGAYGIDAAAHRGALAADGVTVAVLACGVDRPYPASNANLFERIADSGLLVSEWPPGAIPQRHRFLIRNRVIAALTRGTVVVEAALRSGARHTARRARELDRPLMIVPGPVTSACSAGVHQLARDPGEARIVTRAAEIIEDLGRLGEDLAPPLRSPDAARDRLDPVAARLIDAVPSRGAAAPEHIAAQAGVTVVEARRRLPDLAMRGLLGYEEGRYRLVR